MCWAGKVLNYALGRGGKRKGAFPAINTAGQERERESVILPILALTHLTMNYEGLGKDILWNYTYNAGEQRQISLG